MRYTAKSFSIASGGSQAYRDGWDRAFGKGNTMRVTLGRIVHYKLIADDAVRINRRRTDGGSIAERIEGRAWPTGAQAHIGNATEEGQVYPMIVTRVWNPGEETESVNGQVLLDGTDVLWVTSAKQGDAPGFWSWPPRE